MNNDSCWCRDSTLQSRFVFIRNDSGWSFACDTHLHTWHFHAKKGGSREPRVKLCTVSHRPLPWLRRLMTSFLSFLSLSFSLSLSVSVTLFLPLFFFVYLPRFPPLPSRAALYVCETNQSRRFALVSFKFALSIGPRDSLRAIASSQVA